MPAIRPRLAVAIMKTLVQLSVIVSIPFALVRFGNRRSACRRLGLWRSLQQPDSTNVAPEQQESVHDGARPQG